MTDFYGTVAEADAYHAARGNVAWAGTAEAKTASLVRASQALDAIYGSRFLGTVTDVEQSLELR